jgi:tetratricopeptide (TPR) repeat protein
MKKKTPKAWFMEGDENFERRRYWNAIYCYENGLHSDPDNAYAWITKGKIYKTMREDISAKYCFERALQINPENELAIKCLKELENSFQNRDEIVELENVGIYRFIGILCIVVSILSGAVSIVFMNWGSLISALFILIMAIAWFGIARKFETIAYLFHKNHKSE